MTTDYQLEDTTRTYGGVKKRFAHKILGKLAHELPTEARILEIGPGDGHFARRCLQAGHTYSALEPSSAIRTELAKENIDVADALVPPIPREDESFDLVYSSMVLEHMLDYQAAMDFISESRRILRPGGLVCLTFPNAYACGRVFWEMDYSHSFFTTPRRTEQMFRHLSIDHLKSERVLGWFWVTSSPLHHALRVLSNSVFAILNTNLAVNLAEAVGAGGLLWKFRKTFFETAIVIGRKPKNTTNPDPTDYSSSDVAA